jgi:tyrosine-specific transport protein
MMVAYIAQGGSTVDQALHGATDIDVAGIGPVVFASVLGGALYLGSSTTESSGSSNPVETVNNGLVVALLAAFAGILGLGATSANFSTLVDPTYQHPAAVAGCFPILFLALVFQNVVPTVVTQLEGDRGKIMTSIIAGTTIPLCMLVAWNAVVLGNVLGTGVDLSVVNPIEALQQVNSGAAAALGPLVTVFSSLAVTTSAIGFTYGLVEAWTSVLGINPHSATFVKLKPLLYGAVYVPPLLLAVSRPDIFYNALDYGGAFGVSTLFLVLPPLMIWAERYGQTEQPLLTKPMVPFGKIPLGSMWKAAATLIVEQGAEKLGIIHFFQQHLPFFTES